MKKSLLILFSVLFISIGTISAQSLDGVKICIDPGHGGYDPANDRYMTATGFWESLGNWKKANHLKPMLEALGADVYLTRDGNQNSDDISLAGRREYANSINADYFHSIHSNGGNGQYNYTLMLWRGYDNDPVFDEAKEMGAIMTHQLRIENRTTAEYNRGDWDFYDWGTSGLGVLRTLNMPGTLSEGSFHDYIPNSWRLMNDSFLRLEAIGITRSFIKYFDLEDSPYGSIAGIIRDPDENVDYYYISSLGDRKMPVNNIEVTLEPGGKVYNGDYMNNGFFLFDSLEPGDYKIYFTAENYKYDSASVTVQANKTSFADQMLQIEPDYSNPQIIAYAPVHEAEEVSRKPEIKFEFDIRMDLNDVKNAFSITPAVNGDFEIDDSEKIITFTPSALLDTGAVYTVKLDTTAHSIFGVGPAEEFSISFKTRSQLNFLGSYPANNSSDISTTVEIHLFFNGALKQSTMGGNIGLYDADDNSVAVTVDWSGMDQGELVFSPLKPLESLSEYRVFLGEGIGDDEDLFLNERFDIVFTTENYVEVTGDVFEDFEDLAEWWDPEQSGSTTGIDVEATKFVKSYKSVYGDNSGQLDYLFTGESGGVVRVYNQSNPAVGDDAEEQVGMWVYGDMSGNTLEYWFYDNSKANAMVFADTIDWTGWKFVGINIADVALSGNKLFHSIVVKQEADAHAAGTLYFDNALITGVTGIDHDSDLGTPVTFALEQNYPNPFNPSTTISFSVAKNTPVNLVVYNILGEKVRTLISGKDFAAGNHKVMWNGQNDYGQTLSSGVYIYRIEAGDFVQTRKMTLLK